ncbi:MAG: hypothetical protein ACE5GW_02910, partial [Planctomycetota bacterium]
ILLVTSAGCGGGGGGGGGAAPIPPPGPPPATSDTIVYGKNRDLAGNVAPVLTESAAGGAFDQAEVDSPCIAEDAGRVDRFLLFYEATDGAAVNRIGIVSSDEEDFATLTVGRTLAFPLGGPGSGYNFGATDPTVVVDKRAAENPPNANRRYKMWFEGRSGVNGQTSTIIYCTSQNAVTWANFTICTGLDPNFGFNELRVADPSVLLDRDDNDTLKMWFEVVAPDGHGEIGYAESGNGVGWTIMDAAGNSGGAAGPVLTPGAAGGFDAFGVNAPSVILDESIPVGAAGRFLLWYEAGNTFPNTENTIGFASSSNGLSWGRETLPVLRPSSDLSIPLPFDSGDLEHPMALIDPGLPATQDGHFRLWYTGDGENGASPNRIGFATGRTGP